MLVPQQVSKKMIQLCLRFLTMMNLIRIMIVKNQNLAKLKRKKSLEMVRILLRIEVILKLKKEDEEAAKKPQFVKVITEY